ncbi:MAG: amidohydrolase family protein [Vicinamibacterales bacterium]
MLVHRLWAAVLAVLAATIVSAQVQSPLAIVNVTVVDVANGLLLADRTVTIAGGRIQSVVAGTPASPRGVRVVDGRSKYLIPALWDMHVHLSYARSSALPALVAHGVSYVRDVGSRLAELDEWSGEIAAGRMVGPLILRAGPILNGQEFNRYQLAITTAEEARATVRTLEKVGVDLVKVHRRTPREAYFAVAEEARRLSLPLAGHIPVTVTPAEASNAGQVTIEHVDTLFEGTFTAALDGVPLPEAISRWRSSTSAQELFATFVRNGTVIDPTVINGRWIVSWLENPVDLRDKHIAASALREAAAMLEPLRQDAAKMLAERRPLTRELEAVVGQMHRAGVRLVTGTDLSFLFVPGASLHDELQALVGVGLSPAAALRAATLNPAQLFPTLDAGIIAVGKRADLLLLDGNPFEDIRNAARIRAVILAGRLLDRAVLDALLSDAAARAAVN